MPLHFPGTYRTPHPLHCHKYASQSHSTSDVQSEDSHPSISLPISFSTDVIFAYWVHPLHHFWDNGRFDFRFDIFNFEVLGYTFMRVFFFRFDFVRSDRHGIFPFTIVLLKSRSKISIQVVFVVMAQLRSPSTRATVSSALVHILSTASSIPFGRFRSVFRCLHRKSGQSRLSLGVLVELFQLPRGRVEFRLFRFDVRNRMGIIFYCPSFRSPEHGLDIPFQKCRRHCCCFGSVQPYFTTKTAGMLTSLPMIKS